jgi:hypothetical protein
MPRRGIQQGEARRGFSKKKSQSNLKLLRIQQYRQGTRIARRDMKVASQIAKYATPSIWGNPTVTCVGSNAGVWSLQDNMEMSEVLSNQTVRIKIP